jgi:hypothetical protein
VNLLNTSVSVLKKEGILAFFSQSIKKILSHLSLFIQWLMMEQDAGAPYKMSDLNRGLQPVIDQREKITDDGLLRIIRAYKRSKIAQNARPEPYQITGDWAVILREAHADFIRELESENLPALKSILSRFSRDKISRGLSLSGAIPASFREKVILLLAMNRSYRVWKQVTLLPDEVLEYPRDVGQMHGVWVNGRSVILPSFHQSYFAQKIDTLVSDVPGRRTIVEIGGGFGSLAYHLFRFTRGRYSYINLDIPEVGVIAAYFLMNIFPEKKFLLYGEAELTPSVTNECDIIILPNFCIRDLTDGSVDLVFNSNGLSQMHAATIREYLAQIGRICTRYFLHANNEDERPPLAGKDHYINLNNPEYELPKDEFKRIYRYPEIIRNDGILIPEYTIWEYLYERIA